MLEYSFTHGKIETAITKKIEDKDIGVDRWDAQTLQ